MGVGGRNMQEIPFHRRGGQGAVTGSELLAHAFFLKGNFLQDR